MNLLESEVGSGERVLDAFPNRERRHSGPPMRARLLRARELPREDEAVVAAALQRHGRAIALVPPAGFEGLNAAKGPCAGATPGARGRPPSGG